MNQRKLMLRQRTDVYEAFKVIVMLDWWLEKLKGKRNFKSAFRKFEARTLRENVNRSVGIFCSLVHKSLEILNEFIMIRKMVSQI